MPDSNSQDGTSNVGDGDVNAEEDPMDYYQMLFDDDSEGMSGSASMADKVQDPSTANAAADELMLSYHGDTFVFDSVSPDKVEAALLMLGYEVSSGNPDVGSDPVNQQVYLNGLLCPIDTVVGFLQFLQGTDGLPVRSDPQQRAVSLSTYREKKKEWCFEKKVRYDVRKELALRMERKKGQFVSSKAIADEDEGSSSVVLAQSSDSNQDDGLLGTSCTHCGVGSKSTPMMHRGPAGPMTMCNACGLQWSTKGTLRDLSKVSIADIRKPSAKETEQSDEEANESDAANIVGGKGAFEYSNKFYAKFL